MPFSRFEKLAPEKRERLLDVAAQEFASRGFEQASLNRILEQAQMGKGSAYYYFEDKADVFCAVVQYASEFLSLSTLEVESTSLTTENFWPTLAKLRLVPLLRSFERPWLFRVILVAAQVSPSMMEREPLASLARQFRSHVMRLIKRGQEIGVIRTDVPDDLLLAWLLALDQASDHWLVNHWEDLDRDTVAQVSDQTIAALSRAFASGVSSQDGKKDWKSAFLDTTHEHDERRKQEK
jgi:AcrR family transcriptional regulator